ncbi:MAG: nucleoside kinase, partial [Ruminococcus sp.]|nr:nucleoside kinase [Ruminococcus sp.]
MPYKHLSDYDVDTVVPYELSIYSDSLLNQLREMNYVLELADITEVMEKLVSVENSAVPYNSMVREFVGGGEFN